MGIFKKKPKADFSAVQSGSTSSAPAETAAAQSGQMGAAPAQGGSAARTYTVVAGDTLSAIAEREYGAANRWKAIFEANRDQLDDPDRIQPGQVLTLPPAS